MPSSVKSNTKSVISSTQRYMKIAEIHDNTLILKDGSLRTVLQTSSINFNLKSEDEKNAIIYSYQSFINSLEFPIQILVRSKKLDIDKYVDSLKKVAERQKNQLLQRQTLEYIEYVARLVEYADIMEKKFYVVVPYDKVLNAVKPGLFSKFWSAINPEDSALRYKERRKDFETMRKGMTQRVNQIKAGLENIGLKAEQLTTQQLIELFYNTYNPLLARNQKLENINDPHMIQWEAPGTPESLS